MRGHDAASAASRTRMEEWPTRFLYREYLAHPEAFTARVEAFRGSLVPYLRAWERHDVRFGTPSWLSPQWIGMVYKQWYGTSTVFTHHALEEYAGIFSSTCVRIGPYHVPPVPWLTELRNQTNEQFRFTLLVEDEALMYRFPHGHPDAMKRGERNDRFLDAGQLADRLLPVLQALGPSTGTIVLRCASVYATEELGVLPFLKQVDRFLAALPSGVRYALEVNNPEYVLPDYLTCLRSHGVAHLLRDGGNGPAVIDQIQIPGILTTDICVLYSTGACAVEDAVLGVAETVRRCVDERTALYVYVDDRRHLPAPLFLSTLMDALNRQLARLSPIRRKAA